MQIFLTDVEGQNHVLDAEPSDSVEGLMEKIHATLGIPPTHQQVIFGGKLLETGRSLADAGIKPGGFLHLASCSASFRTLHEQPADSSSWHSNVMAEPASGPASNNYKAEPRSGATGVPLIGTQVRIRIVGDSYTGRIYFRARFHIRIRANLVSL